MWMQARKKELKERYRFRMSVTSNVLLHSAMSDDPGRLRHLYLLPDERHPTPSAECKGTYTHIFFFFSIGVVCDHVTLIRGIRKLTSSFHYHIYVYFSVRTYDVGYKIEVFLRGDVVHFVQCQVCGTELSWSAKELADHARSQLHDQPAPTCNQESIRLTISKCGLKQGVTIFPPVYPLRHRHHPHEVVENPQEFYWCRICRVVYNNSPSSSTFRNHFSKRNLLHGPECTELYNNRNAFTTTVTAERIIKYGKSFRYVTGDPYYAEFLAFLRGWPRSAHSGPIATPRDGESAESSAEAETTARNRGESAAGAGADADVHVQAGAAVAEYIEGSVGVGGNVASTAQSRAARTHSHDGIHEQSSLFSSSSSGSYPHAYVYQSADDIN